ncbi:hypothetical protein AAE478_009355 [Parahypoxylon ruwenzoriense]
MIRHPLHSAVGRPRPELNGIAASLRQFSTAQRLAAPENNDNDNDNGNSNSNGNGNSSGNGNGPRTSGRERSTAAFNELMSTIGSTPRQPQPLRPTLATRPGAAQDPNAPQQYPPRPARPLGPGQSQGPNIITVNSLRGGFTRFKKILGDNGGYPSRLSAGNNIPSRDGGGPRPGPGGNFPNRAGPGGNFPSRGGPGSNFPGRGGPGGSTGLSLDAPNRMSRGGGFRGGRGGRGGFGASRGGRMGGDDRPQRSRMSRKRRGGDEGDEEGGRGRGKKRGYGKDGEEKEELLGNDPKTLRRVEDEEYGVTLPFNPQEISLATLNGWGPAIPFAGCAFAQGNTALRQARILGGGRPFHDEGGPLDSQEVRTAYYNRTGLFVPPDSLVANYVTQRTLPKGIKSPPEVKTAVLEDVMLGKYVGPKYAEPDDVLATLENYAKRDSTWNPEAGRKIQDKVRSLLGLSGGGAPAAAPAKA